MDGRLSVLVLVVDHETLVDVVDKELAQVQMVASDGVHHHISSISVENVQSRASLE